MAAPPSIRRRRHAAIVNPLINLVRVFMLPVVPHSMRHRVDEMLHSKRKAHRRSGLEFLPFRVTLVAVDRHTPGTGGGELALLRRLMGRHTGDQEHRNGSSNYPSEWV